MSLFNLFSSKMGVRKCNGEIKLFFLIFLCQGNQNVTRDALNAKRTSFLEEVVGQYSNPVKQIQKGEA